MSNLSFYYYGVFTAIIITFIIFKLSHEVSLPERKQKTFLNLNIKEIILILFSGLLSWLSLVIIIIMMFVSTLISMIKHKHH